MSQDWTPVILRREKTKEQKKRDGEVTTYRNKNAGKNTQASTYTAKNLADDDVPKVEHVSHSLSVQIQQARAAKKMTQKELAQKINEKIDVVRDYENGKAIPNGAVLNKMNKALGVVLKKNAK